MRSLSSKQLRGPLPPRGKWGTLQDTLKDRYQASCDKASLGLRLVSSSCKFALTDPPKPVIALSELKKVGVLELYHYYQKHNCFPEAQFGCFFFEMLGPRGTPALDLSLNEG